MIKFTNNFSIFYKLRFILTQNTDIDMQIYILEWSMAKHSDTMICGSYILHASLEVQNFPFIFIFYMRQNRGCRNLFVCLFLSRNIMKSITTNQLLETNSIRSINFSEKNDSLSSTQEITYMICLKLRFMGSKSSCFLATQHSFGLLYLNLHDLSSTPR